MTIAHSYSFDRWQLQLLLYRRILYLTLIPTQIFRHGPLITHNSTMASAALPSPAGTKMMSNTYPMVQAASSHACGEDGYLKHPHPCIIDGDNRVVGWLIVAWTWFWNICHTIYLGEAR